METITIIMFGVTSLWLLALSFLIWSVTRKAHQEVTSDEIYEWSEEFEREIKLKYNELITYLADLSDRVEQVLKPFIKRNTARTDREQKVLNTEDTYKKGGIIRPSDYRKYGFIK